MYRQLLEKSPLLALPLISLVLFLACFVVIVVRTYARRSEAYAKTAGLPLEDDTRKGEDHV
jgi:cbb3-type cytochrome oxidase subunit 3